MVVRAGLPAKVTIVLKGLFYPLFSIESDLTHS